MHSSQRLILTCCPILNSIWHFCVIFTMPFNYFQGVTSHLGSSFSSGEAATVTWESCSPPSTFFILSRPQSPPFNLLFKILFSYCTYLVFLFPIYGNPYISLYLCQFTQWMSLCLIYFICSISPRLFSWLSKQWFFWVINCRYGLSVYKPELISPQIVGSL